MRVLDVIHRVLLRLRPGEIDVEDEFRIGLARHEEEAHGVAAGLVDQVAQRHVAARPLADLHFLPAAHHRHHLVQHVVGVARRYADVDRLQARAHARNRAVMIRALDVERTVEAALELRHVIRDVGHEVRVAAVGLAHHAVLVVAEIGRAQPQRAFVLVGRAGLHEPGHRRIDASVGVERTFERIAVESHAECGEVAVLFLAQLGDGEAADRLDVGKIVADLVEIALRELADVFAAVAVLGELARFAEDLAGARTHRYGEIPDLLPGVVVVELARDVAALPLEQVRDGVAERRLPAVTDVERSGRIGRDELDDDALAGALAAASVALPGIEDRPNDVLACRGRNPHVDEPGPGNFHFLDDARKCSLQRRGEGPRELARIAARRLRQRQRDIGRVVAVRGIPGTLDDDGRRRGIRQLFANDGGERAGDLLPDVDGRGGVDADFGGEHDNEL